jgi:hypothetical protein
MGGFRMTQAEMDERIRLHRLYMDVCDEWTPPGEDGGTYGDFEGLDLRCLDLSGRNLSGVNFRNADLTAANLSGSKLHDAFMEGANLSWADLSWTRLNGALMDGANLHGTILTGADVAEAEGLVIPRPRWMPPRLDGGGKAGKGGVW